MDDPRGRGVPTTVSHYIIESLVGTGGMGSVYSAVDQRDGTLVAIKLLHPHLADDPSFKERFEREAHVAALLRSPYTVHIIDYGMVDRRYFIAMQYIDGQTLGQALREGPLPPGRALRIAGQAARALEEAQARGVVHRDIKPENILLWGEDNVKISDFGIARQTGAATMTVPGGFYGTLSYAAPEQLRGDADHRTDIWALGATLYHMLAGRQPFSGSFEEIQREIAESPLPLEPLAGQDDGVIQIVSRCLEKDPEARFQSASELAVALERAARGSMAPPAVEQAPRRSQSETTEVMGAKVAPEQLTLRMAPPKMGFPFTARLGSAKYELTVENHGDAETEVWLRAEDRGRRCRFKLPSSVVVGPRSQRRVTLGVRPARRRWRGNRELRVFTVYASAGGEGPPVSVSGRYDDLPYGWVPLAGVATAGAAAALLAGGALAVGVIGPGPEQQPLRIGLLMQSSGQLNHGFGPSAEEYGPAYLNAARLAVGEINEGGGVLGHPVVLIEGDTAGDTNVALQEARRLVDEERVQAIIGEMDVTNTLEIANRVTNPAGIVQIAPISIPDEATVLLPGLESFENDPAFLFKTQMDSRGEAAALMRLVEEGQNQTVCSIYSPDQSGINDVLKTLASDVRIIEVQHLVDIPGNTPVEEIPAAYEEKAVSEVQQCEGADAIVLSTFPDILPAAPDSPNSGITSVSLSEALTTGADILLSSSLVGEVLGPEEGTSTTVLDEIGWEKLAGVKGTRISHIEEEKGAVFDSAYTPRFGEPREDLKDGFESPPDLGDVYDAVYLLALAAEQAGSTDPDAIRQALPGIANAPGEIAEPGIPGVGRNGFQIAKDVIAGGGDIDFEGAGGPIDFGEERDNVRGAVDIWRVDPATRTLVTEHTLVVNFAMGQADPVPTGSEVRSLEFEVPLSVSVPSGFQVRGEARHALILERAAFANPELAPGSASPTPARLPDAYLMFMTPIEGVNPETGQPEAAPADMVSWLRNNAGVAVESGPDEITVGGIQGQSMDVRGAGAGNGLLFGASEEGDEPVRFGLAPPSTSSPGEPARIVVLDVQGKLVVIAAGPIGQWDDATFEALLPEIEAMLASVRFG